jgi:predicted ATPase
VAYRIQLPERFSEVHNVFHVTQLKKGMPVSKNEVIMEANAWIEPDFSLIEHPLKVLDQKERKTRRQTVRMYKIQWSHHTEEEATSEMEDYLNTKYLGFLQSRNREFFYPSFRYQIESRDEIPFKEGRL